MSPQAADRLRGVIEACMHRYVATRDGASASVPASPGSGWTPSGRTCRRRWCARVASAGAPRRGREGSNKRSKHLTEWRNEWLNFGQDSSLAALACPGGGDFRPRRGTAMCARPPRSEVRAGLVAGPRRRAGVGHQAVAARGGLPRETGPRSSNLLIQKGDACKVRNRLRYIPTPSRLLPIRRHPARTKMPPGGCRGGCVRSVYGGYWLSR